MGEDMDHSPVVSLIMTDQAAPLLNMPRASFDMLQEALVHLGPAVKWEPDPTSSEFMSHSWDLSPGMSLRATPPTSALRHHIQMP